MQGSYNIPSSVKGATFPGVEFNLSVDGSLKDLTGATIRIDLKIDDLDETEPTLQLTTAGADPGITITDAANGVFQINEQIIDIEARVYQYDIRFQFPDSTVKNYIRGTWEIIQNITEPS